MVSTHTSKKARSVLVKVHHLKERWKELARNAQQGKIAAAQYLDFELPLIRSILKSLTNLPEILDATKDFAGTSFFLKRAGLPTLMVSVDESGLFNVEPIDGTGLTMPRIEFADADLYVAGILGLSTRETFLKAYVSGRLKVQELHRFRKWAPYVLANLLKIDRSDYYKIVWSASEALLP